MTGISDSIRRLALGLFLSVAATLAHAEPQISGKPIDPQRYLGRWYEVARLPNSFEKNCEVATSDWSREPSGVFNVVQTCHQGSISGPAKSWRGAGRVIDQATAKIRIAFFAGFIKQDYVVVDHSDDYSWCLLSTTNPKFLWIMSRRPGMSAAQKSTLVARARSLGFDTAGLVFDTAPAG